MSDHVPESENETENGPSETASGIQLNKASATKAFAWTVVYAVISKLIFPLGGIYIARTLGSAQYGTFAVILSIVNFSEVLRDAGLTQTFLADPHMNKEKEGSYLSVAILSGIVPSLLLLTLAPFLAGWLRLSELSWALPIASIVVVANGLSTISRAKMLKAGQIKLSGFIEVVGGAIGLALAIVLVYLGWGFKALLAQMIFISAYGLVNNWVRYPVKSIRLSTQAFRDVGKKSLAVLAANGLNSIFLFADQMVIGRFGGVTANGFFGQATNLAYKPADLFVFPLTRTLMVAFSQSSTDQDRLRRVFARSLTVATMIVLPIYVLLAAYSEPLILLLLTHKWAGSIPVLSAMCLYLGFRVLGNISGHALVPAGKHFQSFYPWIACVLLTSVSLYFVLKDASGHSNPSLLMPIVWCFVGGAVFVYSTILVLAMRHLPPAEQERRGLMKAIVVLAVSSVILIGLRMLPVQMYVQLGLAIVLGPIVHLAIIGTFFAGNVFEYLNRSGVKRLWADL